MGARSAAWLAAVAMGVTIAFAISMAEPEVAWAAPAARYRPGMKVRAKRDCNVRGFQVKKGVVMNVTAVYSDDKGRAASADLAFSGMSIAAVPVQVLDSLFGPA